MIAMKSLAFTYFTIAAMAGAPAALAPAFSLPDSTGTMHTRAEWRGKRAIVLVFLSTDCPLSNTYVPELNRINAQYSSRGVALFAVQGDGTVSTEQVQKHVQEFAYSFPYLLDAKESLAAFAGATVTPEAAVFSGEGELLYVGRIDNRFAGFGKQRTVVTEFDLRDTLEAILAGKPVPRARRQAFGCSIAAAKD